MNKRILYIFLCFLLVLYAPFWAYLPALFLGIIIFPLFWEAILISAFVDYYYGVHAYAGTPFVFPFAITAALMILIVIGVKERLRITN